MSGDEPAHDNVANENPDARFVGALPKPLDYYRTHGGDLHDLVKDVAWHGWYRMRECDNCLKGDLTRMKSQAISNAQYDRITRIPANGLIRGRVINVGDNFDATTHIKPQNGLFEKPDEYYFIITDDGTSNAATLWVARLEFHRFTHAPKSEVVIKRAKAKYQKCDHKDDYKDTKSRGDFRDCDKRESTLRAIPWFSCDGGCCTGSWSTLE